MNLTEVCIVRDKQLKPSFCCNKNPLLYETSVVVSSLCGYLELSSELTVCQLALKLLKENLRPKCFSIMPFRETQTKRNRCTKKKDSPSSLLGEWITA